jgi:hypothetical protein
MSEQHQTPLPRPIATIRSPDHKTIYSDTFSVRASPIDMQITFSHQTFLPLFNPQTGMSTQMNAISEQFTVAMPLPMLKGFSIHLTKIIEIIESEIGNILVPKAMEATAENIDMVRQNLRNNPLV